MSKPDRPNRSTKRSQQFSCSDPCSDKRLNKKPTDEVGFLLSRLSEQGSEQLNCWLLFVDRFGL
ncbi:hypothetical protein QCD79_35155, partial [Pseudomonas quasicaspiana]|nr:hypothetical protein [Pseudomonas quasicaspiana]